MNFLESLQNIIISSAVFVSSLIPIQAGKVIPYPMPTPVGIDNMKTDLVTRSGEYSYQGYTLKYSVTFPKNGGKVSGSLDGICKGDITGEYEGGEGGKATGQAKATCKVLFIKYDLKTDYDAYIYQGIGKIDVNWRGDIPYTPGKGSFTINFEPVK